MLSIDSLSSIDHEILGHHECWRLYISRDLSRRGASIGSVRLKKWSDVSIARSVNGVEFSSSPIS